MPAAGDIISIDDINRPRFLGALTLATIANNSVTTLSIASASVNEGSMWSSGSNVTIPAGQGGAYEAGVLLRFATNATNRRQLRINVNGAAYVDYTVNAVASFNTSLSVTVPVVLAAGDVVTFSGYQDSGGSLALVTANNICWLNKVVQ